MADACSRLPFSPASLLRFVSGVFVPVDSECRAIAPDKAMVTNTPTGQCEFRVYQPHASCVELLGTFNGWEPSLAVELNCDDAGWWRAEAKLPQGAHEFCYLVDGCVWLPDYAAGGLRRNADGRWVSQLTVQIEEREVLVIQAVTEERVPGRSAEPSPARRDTSRDRAANPSRRAVSAR